MRLYKFAIRCYGQGQHRMLQVSRNAEKFLRYFLNFYKKRSAVGRPRKDPDMIVCYIFLLTILWPCVGGVRLTSAKIFVSHSFYNICLANVKVRNS